MRQLFLILAISFCSVTVSAQNDNYIQIADYDKLEVSGNIVVEIIPSEEGKLDFIEEKTRDAVEAGVKNGVLKIKGKMKIGNEEALKLKLFFLGDLSKIGVSKGGRVINRDTLFSKHLTLDARIGAQIKLTISAETVKAKTAEGSGIVLKGETRSQNVRVSAWGNYQAYELESSDSYVKATSGGRAKVVARRIIDATSAGPSYIGYIGAPLSTYIKTSLGGEIVNFKTYEIAVDNN